MRLLVLAHVDGDQVLFAAVQRFGQGERGFGLAHAGGAGQQEHADRFVRVVQAGAAGLDALGDHLHGVILADHALGQQFGQAQHGVDLVARHAPDRDAGPVGDDGSNGLMIDSGQDQRRFALERA